MARKQAKEAPQTKHPDLTDEELNEVLASGESVYLSETGEIYTPATPTEDLPWTEPPPEPDPPPARKGDEKGDDKRDDKRDKK